MIWNHELLFLHPQKTAAMAITSVLLHALRGTVLGPSPPGTGRRTPKGVAFVLGLRHENLPQARELLSQFGRVLSGFYPQFQCGADGVLALGEQPIGLNGGKSAWGRAKTRNEVE